MNLKCIFEHVQLEHISVMCVIAIVFIHTNIYDQCNQQYLLHVHGLTNRDSWIQHIVCSSTLAWRLRISAVALRQLSLNLQLHLQFVVVFLGPMPCRQVLPKAPR